MVRLVQHTRKQGMDGTSGVSPRGTLALLWAAQGYALVQGRDYVVPEDAVCVVISKNREEAGQICEFERYAAGILYGKLPQLSGSAGLDRQFAV